MAVIKLISLNIWMGKMLAESLAWVRQELTDACIVTLQEIEEKDKQTIERTLGLQGFYASMMQPRPIVEPNGNYLSVGIFSNIQCLGNFSTIYGGFNAQKPTDWWRNGAALDCQLVGGAYNLNVGSFRVATTHFTWTALPKQDDHEQHESMTGLLACLRAHRVDVLTADLNGPRIFDDGEAGKIWHRLAAEMQDHMPASVETTLDPIHAASREGKKYVVDGVFSTLGSRVQNVQVHSGISDHLGITADLICE